MAEEVPIKEKRAGVIEAEDIRMFLADRTIEDNPLEMDLAFSDEEIQAAMRFAALRFNEMQPYVVSFDPASLPFGYCFMNGTSYFLYLARAQKLQRNDIDYAAGNMSVEINKRRIEHLKFWIPIFKQEFDTTAKDIKVNANLENSYRCF